MKVPSTPPASITILNQSMPRLAVSAASSAEPVRTPKKMCGLCPTRKVPMKMCSLISVMPIT
eukprot:1706875-Rhodomonas_salina.3